MTREPRLDLLRRRLLAGVAAGSALSLAPLGRLLAAAGKPVRSIAGYGPLRPVADLATGLELLTLPAGFSYRSFGWAGDVLADDTPTPTAHDGMGVVAAHGDVLTLVRNHEVVTDTGAFGAQRIQYDPVAGGGAVTLEFDARQGKLLRAWPSLAGTIQNCAGGVTPWGTWLSCEEYVYEGGPSDAIGVDSAAKFLPRLQREHGFVFEVDPSGQRAPVALEALGQFRHEAAAVHAASGIVYLTEDREPRAGFYRFVPNTPGRLADGGRLQMLRAERGKDLRRGLRVGQAWKTSWVEIGEPGRGHSPGRQDGSGVLNQGLAAGGSAFTRLEGCLATDKAIYFTSTNGGNAASGQVFVYYPAQERLALLFESTGLGSVNYPDNIALSPRGGLVLCEDGDRQGQVLFGLSRNGELFPFARNDVRLDGTPHGLVGDYRGSEWAGCCFSPDGQWLFANIYHPGFSVAITGPWRDGLI
jgi:hypothetical protein